MGRSFRFLHAADFRLDRGVQGLSEVPEPLAEKLLEAPYRAAERVVEVALAERVAFVVLAGNIMQTQQAAPRMLAFWREQLERLAERRIDVYWCGGKSEMPLRSWLSVRLPPNVHRFGTTFETQTHCVGDDCLAAISGQSGDGRSRIRASDFAVDDPATFQIAVAVGPVAADSLAAARVDYWALGGRAQRTTLLETPTHAQYCGAPQGLSPSETGPHGCTLVDVGETGGLHARAIHTDWVRWHDEELSLAHPPTMDELRRRMVERSEELAQHAAAGGLLVAWTLRLPELDARLSRWTLGDELAVWLRSELARRGSPLWVTGVRVEAERAVPAAWSEEDTILGDFLRAVQTPESVEQMPAHFRELLASNLMADELLATVEWSDTDTRAALLEEVTRLGAELLRGEGHAAPWSGHE